MVQRCHWRQIYSTICANLVMFCYGTMVGWTSSSIPKLQSEDTPLASGPISVNEVSWVSSILGLGGMIGTLPYCILIERLGRKSTLLCLALPALTSWLLVLFGDNVYHIYIARALAGTTGGGCFLVIPVYVTEIAGDTIRGFLGSILTLSFNTGMLTSFVLCSYTSYYTIGYVGAGVVVTFIGLWFTLHDSPVYLMRRGKVDQGLKEYEYFHGEKYKGDLDKSDTRDGVGSKLSLNDFCGIAQRRSIFLSIILMTLTSSTGVFIFMQYAESIFRDAGSSLSPEMSSITLAIIQLAGSYMASFLVEKAGRKLLIIGSAFLASTCLIIMGIHSFIKEHTDGEDNFAWIPLVCLSAMVFIASHGSASLPYVVICEVLEQKIRAFLVTVLLIWSWVLTFLYLKNLPVMIAFTGVHGTVWFFAVTNIFFSTILYFTLPETKGKSMEEILDTLRKGKLK